MIESPILPKVVSNKPGPTGVDHELTRARTRAPVDSDALREKVMQILNRHPAVGLAVGVVSDGRLEFFYGHGFADVRSRTPIRQDTVFRVGSITKTFTAMAVLQLCEKGLIDLDVPAARYLRAYRLRPTSPQFGSATIRHLLTHTAGIPELRKASDVVAPLFGELVPFGSPLPRLADYYGGALEFDADPGSRFVYTDHDFATLGQIVEDVSGEPLPSFMRERIFRPLGMIDTDLVRSARISSRLATGYDVGSRGPRAVKDYDVITVGGGAAYSTPRDIARYLVALTGGGANEHGSVLKPETVEQLFAPQYQPEPRLPGVGLAFTRFDLDGHPAVEHGGILPGFLSQIFLAPRDGIGVMGFTNGARRGMLWLPAEMSRLLRHAIGVPDDAIRTDVPHHPEIWSDICGWYRLSARLTDVRARAISAAGVEVFVRGGRPMIRFLSPIPRLYRGFELNPDDDSDPYVFRVDLSEFGVGMARVVFSQAPGHGTTRVHCDLMPLTLEKQSAVTNPRLWVGAAAGALVAAAAAGAARGVSHR